jgi:hypothetical protein
MAVLLLAGVTCGVFGRVCGHEFSWWDDPMTIHHNARYNPVSAEKVREVWAGPVDGLYAPVTYTYWGALAHVAEMREADEVGIHLDARVYHAGSLVLHLASVIVVFSILRLLSANVWAARGGGDVFRRAPGAGGVGGLGFGGEGFVVRVVVGVGGLPLCLVCEGGRWAESGLRN